MFIISIHPICFDPVDEAKISTDQQKVEINCEVQALLKQTHDGFLQSVRAEKRNISWTCEVTNHIVCESNTYSTCGIKRNLRALKILMITKSESIGCIELLHLEMGNCTRLKGSEASETQSILFEAPSSFVAKRDDKEAHVRGLIEIWRLSMSMNPKHGSKTVSKVPKSWLGESNGTIDIYRPSIRTRESRYKMIIIVILFLILVALRSALSYITKNRQIKLKSKRVDSSSKD